MFSDTYSDKTLSLLLVLSAAAWGLYWFPLRSIENVGVSGAWSVVYFNACPLIALLPFFLMNIKKATLFVWPCLLASFMIGMAFTLYSNGLVETTVARATLLYYLTPVWSTLIGVLWLSEPLTKARLVAIGVALTGLVLLLSNGLVSGGGATEYPLNVGDLYSLLSGIFWAIGIATLNRWSAIPIVPLATFIFISTTVLSALFAIVLYNDPVPDFNLVADAFPTAFFWSICIMLPGFIVIFRVSQLLYPGRVGILTMSEVVVAIVSAAILLPEETLTFIQWLGAIAIVLAALIEVLFGYEKTEIAAG